MTRKTVLATLAVPAALLAGFSTQNGAGTKVAVVDLQRLMLSNEKTRADEQEIRAWFEDKQENLKSEAEAQAELIRTLRGELEQYRPGTDSYVEKEMQLASIMDRGEKLRTVYQRALNDRMSQIYAESFNRVIAAIDRYAEDRDVDLVLQYASEPIDENAPPDMVSSEIRIRSVIAWRSQLDITEAVLTILDAE